jgi:3-methyl-2-oxobutanoate hydroxymethyltransferase
VEKVTLGQLAQMKRDGGKIVSVVAWDFQLAQIAERAGAEIVSVGDSVGMNLWGQENPLEITLDEMIVVARAVRRGVRRALVSVDLPFGPVQEGTASAVRAAVRLAKEAGADMVKIDGAADFPDAVTAVTRAGIPVWAQFGITPQTTLRHGVAYSSLFTAGAQVPQELRDELLSDARRLESAGAALLDFTNSGPEAGAAVTQAVSIPVLGGAGGGPWLDGRVRMGHAAIGYAAANLDEAPDTYANVAQIALDALSAYAGDVRAARQIRGGRRPLCLPLRSTASSRTTR